MYIYTKSGLSGHTSFRIVNKKPPFFTSNDDPTIPNSYIFFSAHRKVISHSPTGQFSSEKQYCFQFLPNHLKMLYENKANELLILKNVNGKVLILVLYQPKFPYQKIHRFQEFWCNLPYRKFRNEKEIYDTINLPIGPFYMQILLNLQGYYNECSFLFFFLV